MVLLRCICLLQKTKVRGSAVNKTFFLDSFFGNGASVVVEKEFISMKAFMMMQYSKQVSQVQQWQLCLDSKSVYMKTFLMELLMSLPWSFVIHIQNVTSIFTIGLRI